MIYFQQSCGTPSSQESSRLDQTGARAAQALPGTRRWIQPPQHCGSQIFPGKQGRSWMVKLSNPLICLCAALQKQWLRSDGCRWSTTKMRQLRLGNAAVCGTRCRGLIQGKVGFVWRSPGTRTDRPDPSSSCTPNKATLHFQAVSKSKLLF